MSQPLKVKIYLSNDQLVKSFNLILLLQSANMLEHAPKQNEFFLHAPKGTDNYTFWAEVVVKKCDELGIPALVVRSEQTGVREVSSSVLNTNDNPIRIKEV